MAFLPVPSSYYRPSRIGQQQQHISTPTSTTSSSCVILQMGSRGATKWVKKQAWLESRGMADSSNVDTPVDSAERGAVNVNIIIAGAPASGKGTQCEKITEEFGVVHLSTGDMLRAAVAAKTDVGKKAQDFMDAGKLVPDDVMIGIIIDRLADTDCTDQGWLLDGFPRTAAQADALDEAGVNADCFLFLDVPDGVLVERVVGRRTDPDTGKIYHMTFSPPPEDDAELLNRLVHRSDDTEEKVAVRLEQFHSNVAAVKGSYKDIMVTIDGNRSPSDVSQDVMDSIKSAIVKR